MGNTKKILVVDDEQGFVREISNLLSDQGYQVHVAYDGEAASKMLLLEAYSLVVTDIYMPNKDGLELAVELKKGAEKIPVIVMTGGDPRNEITPDQDSYVKILERYGKLPVLRKPFKSNELLDLVRSLLQG